MQLLWRGKWIEAPTPHPVAGSTLIEVDASVPIARLGPASGRRIEDPLRKVASFTVTDGPAATIRKARSKRAEPAYSGDYHLVLVLGRVGTEAEGPRVVALIPRAPACAQWMLAADALVRPAPEGFAQAELAAVAASLRGAAPRLAPLLGQSYLYSAMEPPEELVGALEEALGATGDRRQAIGERRQATGRSSQILMPPGPFPGPGESIILRTNDRAGSQAGAPLAILGAGDYVRIEVAPALAAAGLRREVIADREPQIAALAAAELGFSRATTNAFAAVDALAERGLVVVATAHDSHAVLASAALEAGHRVICEKPAAVTAADLDRLAEAAAASPGELEVGYNRRHNPLVERARREVARERGPATIVASIREVDITPDHWYLWPNQGTRVAGNLCHWIDLALHLLGPGPEPVSVSVSPRVSAEPTGIDAERTFSIAFDDGSAVSLVPTGRGDAIRGVQEQIEVRRGPLTVRLDDLWKLRGLRSGRSIRRRTLWRDKGHTRMYADAIRRFDSGVPAAYPLDDLRRGGEIQIAATELLLAGLPGGEVSELVAGSRARSGEQAP